MLYDIRTIYRKFRSVRVFAWTIFLLCYLIPFRNPAQDRCATDEYQQLLEENYPTIETEEQFEDWIGNKRFPEITTHEITETGDTVFTIPVVVHIIHNGEPVGLGANIPDPQIYSQMEVLNEDFRRMNADTTDTPDDFKARATDPRFEFQLAKQDPEGLPTSGIVRVQGEKTAWTFEDNIELKAQSYWPAEDYLNIWVAPINDTFIGWAQFPESDLEGTDVPPFGRLTDGVVVAKRAFGSQEKYPPADLDPSFALGRTATHEIGHFLGLRHLSGDGNCSADDYCGDTPNSDSDHSGYGSPCTYPYKNTCDEGTDDLWDMFQNFLSLVDDPCMNLFTFCQRERMHIVIQNSPRRASLLTSHALEDPVILATDLGIKRIENPLSESCNGSFTPGIVIRNYGNESIDSAKISLSVDNSLIETVNYTGPLTSLDSANVLFSEFVLTYASSSLFEYEITEVNGASDNNAVNDVGSMVTEVATLASMPLIQNFESSLTDWKIRNDDNWITWKKTEAPGARSGNQGLFINLYDYENGIGARDYFVNPFLDFTEAEIAQLSFKVAHARFSNTSDRLDVAVSTDCGNTFTDIVYSKSGNQLATTDNSSSAFTPENENDWRLEFIDLSAYIGQKNIRIAFISINGHGNNIYLDDIRLDDQLITDLSVSMSDIEIPGFVSCDTSPTPRVRVHNTGTLPVNSFDISYSLIPDEIKEVHISDTIPPGAYKLVALPEESIIPGKYQFDVSVSNPNGNVDSDISNNSATKNYVISDRFDSLPVREGFEDYTYSNEDWRFVDIDNNKFPWLIENAPGAESDNSAAFVNLFDSAQTGSRNWIVSPTLDFSQTNQASLFFKVSHAERPGHSDKLRIYVSQDCGSSFPDMIYDKSSGELAVTQSVDPWIPVNENDWIREYVDLTPYTGNPQVRIAIEAVNDNGNNMYIDDIDMFISDDPDPVRIRENISIYPNPSPEGQFFLTFNFREKKDAFISVYDPTGRILYQDEAPNSLNQTHPFSLEKSPDGLYFVKVTVPGLSQVFRIFKGGG